MSIEDALAVLSEKYIVSAPVRNVDAAPDASWPERYIGLLDYPGIVLYILGVVSLECRQKLQAGDTQSIFFLKSILNKSTSSALKAADP